MDTETLAQLIFEAAVVKRLKRTGWQILGDNEETVGEHTFMTCVIAYLLGKQLRADITKILLMSIFHDFHEARTGDMDKIAKYYMTRDQDKANRDIFAGRDDELLTVLGEFEEKQTLEAKIVYEANVIALGVELKLLAEKGNTNVAEWLTGNMKRVRLPASVALVESLMNMNSQDWWKSIRATLHQEYAS